MENNKDNMILVKDIDFVVFGQEDKTTLVVPVVYNNSRTKIKNLLNSEIFYSITHLKQKNNLEFFAIANHEGKISNHLKKLKSISYENLKLLTDKIAKKYSKDVKKWLTKKETAQKIKEEKWLQEKQASQTYRNF